MNVLVATPALESAPGPIGGRLAWHSADLAADQWIHRLTEEEVTELEAAAASTKAQGIDILDIRKDHFPIPLVSKKVETLRADMMDRFGFGYMRGLPVHRYDRETVMRIYFGLAVHIGDVVPQNRNGHMIGHVIDIGTPVDDYNKRLTQTSAGLSFHSDSCDVVGLVCLHAAMTGGESALCSAIAVHDEMMRRAPHLCRALYQPVTVDRRGEVPEGKMPWMRIPVFMWQNDTFTGYAPLQEYVRSAKRFEEAVHNTPEQDEALDLFFSICGDPEFAARIPFEPGDFQFVHNHVVFHSRTSFRDWPEAEKKRHLMRIWISLPDGRDLHPAIAERWIHIARGAVRGGVNIPNRKALTIPLEPLTPAFS
jgi:hypothetical protein